MLIPGFRIQPQTHDIVNHRNIVALRYRVKEAPIVGIIRFSLGMNQSLDRAQIALFNKLISRKRILNFTAFLFQRT